MGALAIGDVVLVYFPFSDLKGSKLRPAVILADSGRGDWILCQVTSKAYSDTRAIYLTDESFKSGTLDRVSYIRPGKIFTANESIISRKVAVLKTSKIDELIDSIIKILRSMPAHDDAGHT